jgi:hypothetical protein
VVGIVSIPLSFITLVVVSLLAQPAKTPEPIQKMEAA